MYNRIYEEHLKIGFIKEFGYCPYWSTTLNILLYTYIN